MRRGNDADGERIREIYNAEVLGSTVTFDLVPRTVEEQHEWNTAHSGVYPVVVAEVDGVVVGFSSLSPYRPRPAYSTSAEDSVYVAADHRGQGIGKVLLGELIELARIGGFHAVMARIVGDHEASIALHRSLGFELVGIEREIGRKFSRWLDVALMQLLL